MTQHTQEEMVAALEKKANMVNGLIASEITRSLRLHGPIRSMHEALGIIYEEWDEFTDAVRANDPDNQAEELVQIGAMCFRALLDVVPAESLFKLAAKMEERMKALPPAGAQQAAE